MVTIRESLRGYITKGECAAHQGFFHSTEDPDVVVGGSYLDRIHGSMLCGWATVGDGDELCVDSSPSRRAGGPPFPHPSRAKAPPFHPRPIP